MNAALLAYGATRHGPTLDEPFCLAGGIRHWQLGEFDVNRGNPPLPSLVAAAPVLLANPKVDWSRVPENLAVRQDFLAANGDRSFWLITLGRWACIAFSVLGGYVCFRWASDLYGVASGLVSLSLWCFCPIVLAHGQLITGDMAATALGAGACYLFWRWLGEPSLGRAALAGLALGLAELTKFVWVILYFLWPCLWLLLRWSRGSPTGRRSLATEAGHGLLMVLLSLYVINLGYMFEKPLQPLGRIDTGRKLLEPGPGAPGPAAWLEAVRLPLPGDYVGGLAEVGTVAEDRYWSYLAGEWRRGGWWYFYPCAFLLKLPLATLGLLALACTTHRSSGSPGEWKRALPVLVPIVVVLGFVTWSGSPQHLRYALPVLFFALIWAGKPVRTLARRRWGIKVVIPVLLSWATLSSLFVYPHSLAYFNELAGGPRGGHEYLVDSNMDWGQDLLYLKRWLDAHPEASPVHVAYSGCVDPRLAGIESKPIPRRTGGGPGDEGGWSLEPGWYAVSVNLLHSHRWATLDSTMAQDYPQFRHLRPTAMAGYSIYIYHVTSIAGPKVLSGRPPECTLDVGTPDVAARSRDIQVRPAALRRQLERSREPRGSHVPAST